MESREVFNLFCTGFSVVMTAGVLYSFYSGISSIAGVNTASLRSIYGFLIGSAFSGVIGVGFYPLLGSRVWCRFGCPMAAILGIQQKFFPDSGSPPTAVSAFPVEIVLPTVRWALM